MILWSSALLADSLPWFVVFDLDDTLIAEHDYQISGIVAVEKYLESLYSIPIKGALLDAHGRGVYDIWGHACDLLGLPSSVVNTLSWVYRLHTPQIQLQPGVSSLLATLRSLCVPIAILSDGRSVTQRLKLKAIDLLDIPSFLSEEWCSTKPDSARFQAIVERWPDHRYTYIGDNPAKDFQAPTKLGWLTLGAAWTPKPIYSRQSDDADSTGLQPYAWLQSPQDLLAWLS